MDKLLSLIFNKPSKVICPLVGGMMNKSYIVECDNKKYVLYISTPQANEMVDRPIEKDNQRIVYELGITSKNIYFDTNKGIKVNEYIEGSSLDKADSFDYLKVATLFKRLHSSKKLSKINYCPFARFVAYEEEAKGHQKQFSDEYVLLRNTVFDNKDFLESQPLVLSHNDCQKSNIVKDLNDNYFLIDFEFVGNNDEIYDIATFGNGLVSEGYRLLEVYFDGHPSIEQKKRYYLWRIFISLQWHNVAITKHYRGEGKTHGYDFLKVAEFFLSNAEEAYQGLQLLK